MVFYHVERTEDFRDSLRTGPLTVTRTLLGGAVSLARRLGPREAELVVELEPIDDDEPLGWTPGLSAREGEEEVA